jgi:hypothetical protein
LSHMTLSHDHSSQVSTVLHTITSGSFLQLIFSNLPPPPFHPP